MTILRSLSTKSSASDRQNHRGSRWGHRREIAGSLVSLLMLGSLFLGCSHPHPRSNVNVVVITLDTLRSDVLGAYGSSEELSPNLDSFARRSFVFEHAASAIGTTLPSHTTMFTGLYPRHHGVRWNGGHLDRSVAPLAQILKDDGYTTAAFVSAVKMFRHGGLNRGFDTYYGEEAGGERHRILTGKNISARVLDWLGSSSDRPFFLWVHFYVMHSPYAVTPYAREQFSKRGYSGPLAEGVSAPDFQTLRRTVSQDPTAPWALRALYKGELIALDKDVGAILARLGEPDLKDNTFVAIAADHGQDLGEHGTVGHGFLLWQPVLHVPLILHLPGEGAGHRIAGRVSLVDLMPTILGYLHLPGPPHLDGISLVPVLRGSKPPVRIYFGEVRKLEESRRRHKRHGRGEKKMHVRGGAQLQGLAAYDGEVKAIWLPHSYQVFDLTRDPGESDSAGDAVSPAMKSALLKAIKEFNKEKPLHSGTKPLDPKLRKELKSLGYVE